MRVRRRDPEAGERGGVRVIVAMGVGVGVRAETVGGGDGKQKQEGGYWNKWTSESSWRH